MDQIENLILAENNTVEEDLQKEAIELKNQKIIDDLEEEIKKQMAL